MVYTPVLCLVYALAVRLVYAPVLRLVYTPTVRLVNAASVSAGAATAHKWLGWWLVGPLIMGDGTAEAYVVRNAPPSRLAQKKNLFELKPKKIKNPLNIK